MSSTGNTSSASKIELSSEAALVNTADEDVEIAKRENFENLDPQYRAFALEFLANGFKHREAAETVGFAASSGLKLRRLPVVAAYINYLQDRQVEEFSVSQAFIDAKLDDLYDMAIGDVEVPFIDSDGQEQKGKKFHGDLALNIIKTKSAMHGHIKQEGSKGGNVYVNVDLGAALGEQPVDITGEAQRVPAESLVTVEVIDE